MARTSQISEADFNQALKELPGRDIPISATYRILSRHEWRKLEPDTKHPKSFRFGRMSDPHAC